MSPGSAVVGRRLAFGAWLAFALVGCQGPDEYFRNEEVLTGNTIDPAGVAGNAGTAGGKGGTFRHRRQGLGLGGDSGDAGATGNAGTTGGAGTFGRGGTAGTTGRRPRRHDGTAPARRARRADGGTTGQAGGRRARRAAAGRRARRGSAGRGRHDGHGRPRRYDGRGGHDRYGGPRRHDGHCRPRRHDGTRAGGTTGAAGTTGTGGMRRRGRNRAVRGPVHRPGRRRARTRNSGDLGTACDLSHRRRRDGARWSAATSSRRGRSPSTARRSTASAAGNYALPAAAQRRLVHRGERGQLLVRVLRDLQRQVVADRGLPVLEGELEAHVLDGDLLHDPRAAWREEPR